jgi:hypothetical protein
MAAVFASHHRSTRPNNRRCGRTASLRNAAIEKEVTGEIDALSMIESGRGPISAPQRKPHRCRVGNDTQACDNRDTAQDVGYAYICINDPTHITTNRFSECVNHAYRIEMILSLYTCSHFVRVRRYQRQAIVKCKSNPHTSKQ